MSLGKKFLTLPRIKIEIKITKLLKVSGWQVVRIWEHEIKVGKLYKLTRRIATQKSEKKEFASATYFKRIKRETLLKAR